MSRKRKSKLNDDELRKIAMARIDCSYEREERNQSKVLHNSDLTQTQSVP